MADAARIQAKIWRGYGQAAKRLGLSMVQYRPTDPMAPIAAASQINAALLASLVVNFDFAQPNKYGSPTWKLLADGTGLRVGDYLVGVPGTYFVAAIESMLPMVAVECNRVLAVGRAPAITGPGIRPYGGATQANAVPLLAGWPASVLEGTKGQATVAGLPGDNRAPWWKLLMPAIAGVTLQYGDIITDDIGRIYSVSSAEQTDMGWRLTASQSEI